jgi:thiol:disulfide interchange protein
MTMRQLWLVRGALIALLGMLGTYKIGPKLYNRHRLGQLQGRQVYDERLNAQAAFTGALAQANDTHKRLVVVVGGNWCQWCLVLDDLLHQDDTLRSYLAQHYVLLKLDSQAAKSLDESWGRPSHNGVPVLIFFAANGAVKHIQETGSLELWRGRILGHDPKRVLSVLQRWS